MQYEILEYENLRIRLSEIESTTRIRPLLNHYFQNIKGFIFVIDSSDKLSL